MVLLGSSTESEGALEAKEEAVDSEGREPCLSVRERGRMDVVEWKGESRVDFFDGLPSKKLEKGRRTGKMVRGRPGEVGLVGERRCCCSSIRISCVSSSSAASGVSGCSVEGASK